ncbi:uncharacterized protein EV420DRAFT_1650855 [Desarmillaria tabescens]|uniref:C2H2-type domain-containing protein n=1 Tax=Armillaria tabescens TaxID=1929756 RepID=A0AA39JF90_ARMTA|nr:uncharacterized protein EV420DRAFT_1650855 [Desarmillaria tabescens]KAK0439498.1 hypothetical protein EV420DRAFT_1650855 [Desarmillaria tabescens]
MSLNVEQNQQEQYNCEKCGLKFQTDADLANHWKLSSIHEDITTMQPEPSCAALDHEEPNTEPATIPSSPESITGSESRLPVHYLDELIFVAEWNEEFFRKEFPGVYATGNYCIPDPPKIPKECWISLIQCPDSSQNDHELVVDSSDDTPASVTGVDDGPSMTD